MSELTPAQTEVVAHPSPSLLVVAGAGSGKTRAITHRAARLIDAGAFKNKILVITFTRYAAREFQHRLDHLLGKEAKRVWTGTIHSVGRKLLLDYGVKLGLNPKFKVFDETKSRKIIREILQALKKPHDPQIVTWVAEQIEGYKVHVYTPEHLMFGPSMRATYERDPQLMEIYRKYQHTLESQKGMDLTDLVCKAVYMLQLHPEIAEELGLEHILVDEFQDTDPTQVALVQLLRQEGTALTCCGDVDQSLYSFRGAEPRIMLNFNRYFPESEYRYLSENHRSTQTIVDSAVQVIAHNEARIRHGLRSTGGMGEPITLIPTKTEGQEAEEIAKEIETLVEDKSFDPPLQFKEIAVLYRTNWQAEALAHIMKGLQVPCRVLRGSFTAAKKTEDDDKVQLLTIHAAKGSEFRVVFVAGVEEDLLPHYNALCAGNRKEAVEEERRLMYVAMTRAKEKLYLSHTRIRTTKSGYTMEHIPSRFLTEIPDHLIEVKTERRKLYDLSLR